MSGHVSLIPFMLQKQLKFVVEYLNDILFKYSTTKSIRL